VHESRARLFALLYAVTILGGLLYVADSYSETRRQVLADRAQEASILVAKPLGDTRVPTTEERYVPPAPIVYPYF